MIISSRFYGYVAMVWKKLKKNSAQLRFTGVEEKAHQELYLHKPDK